MTQEEIDAILGEDSRQSSVEVEVVSLPEEEDDSMEGDALDIIKDVSTAIRYLNKKKLCLQNFSGNMAYLQMVLTFRKSLHIAL